MAWTRRFWSNADDREKSAGTTDPSRSASSIDEKVSPDDHELVHGDFKRMDVGLKVVAGHSEEPEISPSDAKRIRRKIDWNLLPLLCVIYMGTCPLCYLAMRMLTTRAQCNSWTSE